MGVPLHVIALVLGLAGAAGAVSIDTLVGHGRLVAWAPRDPGAPPSARALRIDGETLSALGFRSVTMRATTRAAAPACRFFKRRGVATVLVGIADPGDAAEVRRAVRLRRCADGYVVGDGGLAAGRYDRETLARAIAGVRSATGRPVTTREPLATLRDDPGLARLVDWLFPTIRPWDAGRRESQDACGFTIFAYRELAARAPAGIPTVIAETGLPTAGDPPASEHYQRAFLLCLASRDVPFAHPALYDDPASPDPLRAHGGLFRADGAPKLWAAQQLRPTLSAARAGGRVAGRVDDVPRDLVRVVAYVQRARWEALPPVAPDRRGAWTLAAPPDRPVAVYVVTRTWTAPPALDRRPRLDRMQVLAERELPAL